MSCGRPLAALLLALLPAGAYADIESPLVRQGLEHHRRLECEQAIAVLDQATRESLTRDEKAATFRALALCQATLGRADDARRSFERLLTVEPGFEPDLRVAPRIRSLFEEARVRVATRGVEVAPAHRVPEARLTLEPALPREQEKLVLRVEHRGGLARRAQLFVRPHGAASFTALDAPAGEGGRFTLEVPGAQLHPPALDYYLIVVDDAGAAVARAGTLGSPLTIAVRARPVPLHRRRWFWGTLGASVGTAALLAMALGLTLTSPATVTILPQ